MMCACSMIMALILTLLVVLYIVVDFLLQLVRIKLVNVRLIKICRIHLNDAFKENDNGIMVMLFHKDVFNNWT